VKIEGKKLMYNLRSLCKMPAVVTIVITVLSCHSQTVEKESPSSATLKEVDKNFHIVKFANSPQKIEIWVNNGCVSLLTISGSTTEPNRNTLGDSFDGSSH